MALRQEQVVFLATAALVGLLVAGGSGGRDVVRGGGARASELEPERFAPPEVERALPAGDRIALSRGVFSPPRDTRPLAPLDLVEPPRELLVALSPPPEPGPAPRRWADFLHALPAVTEVPGLFGSEETADLPAVEGAPAPGDVEDEDDALEVSERARATTEGLGGEAGDVETAAERAARVEGYKQVYDWIRLDDYHYLFGRIENEDRYGVTDPERDAEPILFVELDPETGSPRMPGQSAIAYDRERVTDLGFANTIPNRVELRRRELADLSPGEYLPALELADWCVRVRHEAPRALEVARGLYEGLAELDPGDPMPRLGLARCLEAGFDFEGAFEEYRRILEQWPHRAVSHVRFAQLEERFLLHDQAEERLRHAVSLEPSAFEPNHALGRFLLERDRGDEAIPFLERASKNAPTEPERKDVRTRIRYDLARAQVFAGRVEEARTTAAQLVRGDPEHPLARAALLSTRLLDPSGEAPEPAGATAEPISATDPAGAWDGVLELRVARGLAHLRAEEWERARDELLAATEIDPLRANVAWRALSWLAEVTGYPDQALRYAEQAVECDPGDAYALYQRGRLLARSGDPDGARESLRAALAVDVELEDAVLALGDLAYETGRFEDAERYLERAALLAPERADVRALRGVNFLVQGLVEDARASFEAAEEIDPSHPTPHAGLAWVAYLSGEPEEALIQLANLDERRRALSEDDPWRVWAAGQIDRLSDHLEKVAWSDSFERREIRNRWFVEEKVGPLVEITDGVVAISGVFDGNGTARLYREYPAGVFVSFEADVRVRGGGAARVGIFLSRERERRGETDVISEAALARHKDGTLQARLLRSGATDAEWRDVTDFEFPADEWVRLRVERAGEGGESVVTLSIDGVPVVEDEPLVGLGQATSAVRVGVFAEGETGRQVHAEIDDVEVVFRQ